MILVKAIYLTATAVLIVIMLIVAVPFLICSSIAKAWRWIELHAVYGGDEGARRKAEWKAGL